MKSLGANEPRRVGPYRLLGELGSGGMGRVLLATSDDGELVALKMVHPHLLHEDEEYRYRFRREVLTSREAASGPYTAAVVDADADAEQPWLASGFFFGPTLAKVLASGVTLDEHAVFRLAGGMANALVQIHGIGVMHRDLKPSNVLLTEKGVRLIDFGIARARGAGGDVTLTRTGAMIGAPGFMSPEQVNGREDLTPKSDIFSLGTTLITAFTGANPFESEILFQTLRNVADAQPDLERIPARLRRVVERCMERDPDARPSAGELLALVGAPDNEPQWPQGVRDLDQRQRGEVSALVREHGYATRVRSSDERVVMDAGPAEGSGNDAAGDAEILVEGPTIGWFKPSVNFRVPKKTAVGIFIVLIVIALGVSLSDNVGTTASGSEPSIHPSSEPSTEYSSAPSGGSGDFEDSESSPRGTETPDPVADAEVGDCFYSEGTESEPELEPASSCESGSFEVLEIFYDTTDLDRCDDVDDTTRSFSSGDSDLVLCLRYNHDEEAYYAEPGHCIWTDDSEWSIVDCDSGVFRVLESIPDTNDDGQCSESVYRNHSLTYPGSEDFSDVLLCLQMVYPDGDIGYASQNTCLFQSGSEPDAYYEFVDCDRANVIVTGRTSEYHAAAFCGEGSGWNTYQSEAFPSHAYTVCVRSYP